MRNILWKEMKLAASPLSYLFLAFGLMFFLPGYPVLCGAFFITLGLFQSFQRMRESNDIVFSALLPIAKRDVVKGKLAFVSLIELAGILIMTAAVLLRATVFSASQVYVNNALMNANGFALGVAFLVFGLFNLVFVGGFFRTAYKFTLPFVSYIIISFLVIGAAEALHYFPGCSAVNAFGFSHLPLQLGCLGAGAAAFLLLTLLAFKVSAGRFEKIDL